MTTHADLAERTQRALDAEQCTSHARRAEHADPAASPPPDAVARWVGQNGAADLLCTSCLKHWLDNAA